MAFLESCPHQDPSFPYLETSTVRPTSVFRGSHPTIHPTMSPVSALSLQSFLTQCACRCGPEETCNGAIVKARHTSSLSMKRSQKSITVGRIRSDSKLAAPVVPATNRPAQSSASSRTASEDHVSTSVRRFILRTGRRLQTFG